MGRTSSTWARPQWAGGSYSAARPHHRKRRADASGRPTLTNIIASCIAILLLTCAPLHAQWVNVPPARIPRTPDGKPNLSAPAPRLSDGKPDLSGIWNPPGPPGYLGDLARDLKEDVP